jgi:hypothetical protein
MAAKRYTVTSECIDARSGNRLLPGVEFLPAPTDEQVKALTDAGCIKEGFTDPKSAKGAKPAPADDGLDVLDRDALIAKAKETEVAVAEDASDDDIRAAIRAKAQA